jgi:hypothetical protein
MARCELLMVTVLGVLGAVVLVGAPVTGEEEIGEVGKRDEDRSAGIRAEPFEAEPASGSCVLGFDGSLEWHSNPYYREKGREREGYVARWSPDIRLRRAVNEYVSMALFGNIGVRYFSFGDRSGDVERETPDEAADFVRGAYEPADETVVHPYVEGEMTCNPSEHADVTIRDRFQSANVGDALNSARFYLNEARIRGHSRMRDRIDVDGWCRNTTHWQTTEEALFDFTENAIGAGCGYVLNRTEDARLVRVGVAAALGTREYDKGGFAGEVPGAVSRENPKTYDYQSVGLTLACPLAGNRTLNGRVGWTVRDYAAESRTRDARSQGPEAGLTVEQHALADGRLSATVSALYQAADTVIYGAPDHEAKIFESTDALLNDLDVTYRELDVRRAGVGSRYRLSERLTLDVLATFQRSEAPAEENLGAGGNASGTSGAGRGTRQDEWFVAAGLSHRLTENVTVGLTYRHGESKDRVRADGGDLYSFDSFGVTGRAEW